MKAIYLDNNATTKLDAMALEAMLPLFTEQFGNPSSIHSFADKVGAQLKIARRRVADLIGALHETEIIFTSCATESTTTAIYSALKVHPHRKEIITTVVEHPATLEVCEQLELEGYKIHWLKVDKRGRVDLNEYQKVLSDNVALVSVMWANNETGTLFPILEMAQLARQKGILFHTDAVQAAGKIPIEVQDSGIDMLSFSGHKLHAPKGIGALYVRRGIRYRPLLRGGHQERGRRAGTENCASIVAFGVAAEQAELHLETMNGRIKTLRDKLEKGILAQVEHAFVTGDPSNRTANTCNIAFEYVEGEAILMLLNQQGIAASSGSACTSGSLEPSHVMQAMSIPFTAAHGTIRFSLSRYTTEKEIDKVIDVIAAIIDKLRLLSPYWQNGKPVEMERFAPTFA
ncbi:cysteine desulfurase NifS [Psychromonas antarctica]|jgi:cysteine desulfurase|uniref:cysteine desulfurase NifS n=1 Tax=Psychromonas antarctica TaxID=67573 RepID=UPI001EE86C59|nr:cysteine desulfurase NifS [Psychromonas antarctica]MCG6200160.1 cysteine desulfurase NifS [Psychromonas antarctica]